MKVDVVIESHRCMIEKVTVHVSKDEAIEHIKKWFRENTHQEKNYSEDYNYQQWLNGNFEFDKNEIFHAEDVDLLGSDGADLCKNCREHTPQPETTGLTDEEFQRIAAEWDNYDHDTKCMILDGIGYSSKYADYPGNDLTHGLAKEIDQFKPPAPEE